jgi:hypothetical protein
MATITATAAQTGVQPKGLRVGLTAVKSTYSVAGSISIGTTIQMVKVPAGATPMFVQYGTSQAGQFTMSVGDGIADGRYKSVGTFSAGQGMVTSNIVQTPYTYSQDDTIDFLISLVSVSTLGGAFYLNVIFSMDAT